MTDWKTKYLFNLNSSAHKRNLFYDRLGNEPTHWTDSETNPVPKTTTEALQSMGVPGKALIEYNERAKILSMVNSMIGVVGEQIDEQGLGRAHVGLRVPGTATGRCGGTDGLNLQNIPKDEGYLTAMVPEPGHKLVTFDICYTADTEVLTDRGFLHFNEVTRYDKVAAVDPATLRITWETPKRILWKKYYGTVHTFSNASIRLSVTEGHKMLWVGQQSMKRNAPLRSITKAEVGIPSLRLNSMMTAAKDMSVSRFPKKEIWLATMIQADAHVTARGSYVVEVSRPLKVAKVKELLGVEGQQREKRTGQTLHPVGFPSFNFTSSLLVDKKLKLSSVGASQAKELFKALAFWDGSMMGTALHWRSTDKVSYDEICTYFSRVGYSVKQNKTVLLASGKSYYRVTIKPNTSTRIKYYNRSMYKGYVGCVTVSTGFIMVRAGGHTAVCGNCALEPTVLTSASGCKTLNAVYGPGAPLNGDIYSFVGAQLGGELGRAITATGYDWKNPTPESTAKVKKDAKKWRNIAKVLHLSCISEGTSILTRERGYISIQDVLLSDTVWDGQEFVSHEGVIFKGEKDCIELQGVFLTPDHKVLTNTGWVEAQQVAICMLYYVPFTYLPKVKKKVYDILNCGPRSRFTVYGKNSFIVHNCSYGAGPGKIRQSLGSSGIEISINDVKTLHANYWKLFGGVKTYEKHLVSMWERNGGWFLNPAGLPQAIHQDRIRDVVNSSIQGGSHYLFMVMTKILADTFKEHSINYKPYIWDVHDCVMFSVPTEQAARAKELADGLVLLRFNEAINGSVTLRADANVVDNFWQDKME